VDEGAGWKTRSALGAVRQFPVGPGRSGDVEMEPRFSVNEFLQEKPADDGPSLFSHGRDVAVPGISKLENFRKGEVVAVMSLKGELVAIGIALLSTPEIIKKDKAALAALSSLQQIFTLLQNSFQIQNLQIDLSIVRGLDYYKGLVFEIDAPILGAEKQLCGGGAYDLVSLFGGTEVATAGFAIGFDRTILALEAEHYNFPSGKTDVYIIPVNENMIPTGIELAQQLRNKGIITDVDLLRRGIAKALKYANTKQANTVVIIGPKELEQNAVTLRDMHTGKQEQIKFADVVTKLKSP